MTDSEFGLTPVERVLSCLRDNVGSSVVQGCVGPSVSALGVVPYNVVQNSSNAMLAQIAKNQGAKNQGANSILKAARGLYRDIGLVGGLVAPGLSPTGLKLMVRGGYRGGVYILTDGESLPVRAISCAIADTAFLTPLEGIASLQVDAKQNELPKPKMMDAFLKSGVFAETGVAGLFHGVESVWWKYLPNSFIALGIKETAQFNETYNSLDPLSKILFLSALIGFFDTLATSVPETIRGQVQSLRFPSFLTVCKEMLQDPKNSLKTVGSVASGRLSICSIAAAVNAATLVGLDVVKDSYKEIDQKLESGRVLPLSEKVVAEPVVGVGEAKVSESGLPVVDAGSGLRQGVKDVVAKVVSGAAMTRVMDAGALQKSAGIKQRQGLQDMHLQRERDMQLQRERDLQLRRERERGRRELWSRVESDYTGGYNWQNRQCRMLTGFDRPGERLSEESVLIRRASDVGELPGLGSVRPVALRGGLPLPGGAAGAEIGIVQQAAEEAGRPSPCGSDLSRFTTPSPSGRGAWM